MIIIGLMIIRGLVSEYHHSKGLSQFCCYVLQTLPTESCLQTFVASLYVATHVSPFFKFRGFFIFLSAHYFAIYVHKKGCR